MQELGIARYERKSSGFTDWFICVHELPQHPVKPAHSKKSHGKKSRGKLCHALTSNEESLIKTEQSLTKKEKTTDDVTEIFVENRYSEIAPIPVPVVIEPIRYSEIEINIAEFNPQQRVIAQKSLAKVPVATQLIVLMMLKVALIKGSVKSPLAYLNALINKSIAGELDVTRVTELQKQTAKPLSREEVIRQLFAQHSEQIKIDLIKTDSIVVRGIGVISKFEFEKLGLIGNMTETSGLQTKAQFFKNVKELF
ncbi:MAG: hypothetical protein PHD53_09515 [Methylococcales bacterium]|nr:hypothetical protein [Methylococcales bacterium]